MTEVASSPTLRRAMVLDFRTSGWGPRVALMGVVAWLVYEWGPGNETVTPWVLANLLDHFDGITSVFVVGVVAFVFTTLQQLASGFTALAGFSVLHRTAHASWERLERSNSGLRGGWWSMRWSSRVAVVFGLGTTAVALMQIITTGQVGVRTHARAVATSAAVCGATIAAVSAVCAGIVAVGRAVDAWSDATDRLVGVLASPWPWLVLAVAMLVREVVAARRAGTQVVSTEQSAS
jgi:hypothetical protein